MRILYVRDRTGRFTDPPLAHLRARGHTVTRTLAPEPDETSLRAHQCVVFDLGGDRDGVLRRARRVRRTVPDLVLVARVDDAGFGAADVDWPFDELVRTDAGATQWDVRLRLASARRPRPAAEDRLPAGLLATDLTPDQRRVLGALLEHQGEVLSRRDLIGQRPGGTEVRDRSMDVFISRLRAKIVDHGYRVTAVHRRGYRLDAIRPPEPSISAAPAS